MDGDDARLELKTKTEILANTSVPRYLQFIQSNQPQLTPTQPHDWDIGEH